MKRAALALLIVCMAAADLRAQSSTPEQGDQGEHDEEMREVVVAPPSAPVEQVPEHAGMLRIPGAAIVLGGNERTLKPYWLDRTEVTVAAYRRCVVAGACPVPGRSSPYCTFDRAGSSDELPVSCVRHAGAVAFCMHRGARLPSEAEWELAARGRTEHKFPWGDARPACAVAATLRSDHTAKSCTGDGPARVGTHPLGRSPFGIEDLAGNVEEWTADFFVDPMPAAPPKSGASFVLRGGSWLLGPSYARTDARSAGSSMEAGPGVGFRCAKGA